MDQSGGAGKQVEWLYYGGDQGGTKYSTLTEINPDSVQRLQIAWQWKHFDVPMEQYDTTPGQFEAVPLMIDGVLYVTTPYNNIAALDAETGKALWRYKNKLYIFLNSRNRLFKLDAQTGKPAADFGSQGWSSLTAGLPRISDERHYTQSSPP